MSAEYEEAVISVKMVEVNLEWLIAEILITLHPWLRCAIFLEQNLKPLEWGLLLDEH